MLFFFSPRIVCSFCCCFHFFLISNFIFSFDTLLLDYFSCIFTFDSVFQLSIIFLFIVKLSSSGYFYIWCFFFFFCYCTSLAQSMLISDVFPFAVFRSKLCQMAFEWPSAVEIVLSNESLAVFYSINIYYWKMCNAL